MSSENHIEVPDDMEKQPDRLIWHNGGVLIKYEDDNVTMRAEDIDRSEFEEAKNFIESGDVASFIVKTLGFVDEASQVTQIGSKIEIDGVPERFRFNCPNCQGDVFQIRGQYTGKHASCISCGNVLSIIIKKCVPCDDKSIFVKNQGSVDDWYECYECHSELP